MCARAALRTGGLVGAAFTVSEVWVVALAAAATLGAWSAWAVPLWLGVPLVLAGMTARQPLVLVAGVLALAAGLSARAWAGTAPATPRPVDAVVTLVSDPVPVEGAVTAVVRLDGHRYEAWARAGAGRRLAARLAGERLQLIGQIRPVAGGPGRRLAERHVIGRLSVSGVGDSEPGGPLARSANRVRRALVEGARSLPPAERALYTGFVLGDDRDEPPEVVDDFRASGLAHLTAVSGENVAFVLALAGPLLRRLGLVARAGTTVALLGWFALLTRFEPSVLRAVVMAGLATVAVARGHDAGPLRVLALAVTGLTLVDPLLVWSVSWWLSVGATLGIVALSRPLTARLPGPEGLRAAVAVTVAAQIGVAPVSGVIFGGIPLVSIPANLLAAPVAGPLMVWGLAAGAVAAFAPAPVAAVLHLPTQLGVRWIALVARVGARLPVGLLGPAACIALAGAAATALAVLSWPTRAAGVTGRAEARSPGGIGTAGDLASGADRAAVGGCGADCAAVGG